MARLVPSLSIVLAAACGAGAPATTPTAPAEPTAAAAADVAGPVAAPDAAPDAVDQEQAALVAAEHEAFARAKPVFARYCIGCHVRGGADVQEETLVHFDMTRYPFGGHHAGEITAQVRNVLGLRGGNATMPKNQPGAVVGDELALIMAWADAYDASHAAATPAAHGH